MSKKPFAVFDIDGTLIRWQLYHAVVQQLAKQGYITVEDAKKVKTARMQWKNRNSATAFHDYEITLVKTFLRALPSIPPDVFHAANRLVFEEHQDQVYVYTRNLIRELKEKGYVLFAISGSFQEILQMMGDKYGFDEVVGPELFEQAGRFTGESRLAHTRKGAILKELVEKHDVSWQGSVAVGDSPSDIAMLELVEVPIAFNPTKNLYEHAKENGWKIVVERKDVTYEIV